MTVYVGGLRARLIRDSLFYMLRDALTDLGWLNNAQPSHLPITLLAEPTQADQEVPLNTVALADDDLRGEDVELGSGLAEQSWSFFVDFYAENDPIGLHLIRDVKDILEGRMASIGRTRPILVVQDWTLATPVAIFTCEIEDVSTARAHDFPHAWLRHWHTCSFTVVDVYENENVDDPTPLFEGFGGF